MNIDAFHPLILNVGRTVHNADWNWQNVCSPFARIYYMVSGRAQIVVGEHQYQLSPDNLYMIPPYVQHSTSCSGRFEHFYVHVYENIYGGSGIFDEFDFPFEIKATEEELQMFERLTALNPFMQLKASNPASYDNEDVLAQSILQNQQRSEWLRLECRGITYRLFSRFMMEAKEKAYIHDERIHKSVRYIQERLTQSLSIHEMARDLNMSEEHFIRLFNKMVGSTPMLFINQKRIEKAQLLLLTTDATVKEISEQMGYTNSSYFVRVFRQVTGMTPLAYKKENSI